MLPATAPSRAPLPDQTNSLQRILVVEDDDVIRRLNADALTHFGYDVDVAEDGAAAWSALQLGNYDLVVTDNDMPKVTGVELLRKIHEACLSLPVIMATGTLPTVQLARQPWFKPAAMLVKPYSIAELVATVREVLRAIVTPPGQGRNSTPVQVGGNFLTEKGPKSPKMGWLPEWPEGPV
jgi:DNA-binding response OmpR family regulator